MNSGASPSMVPEEAGMMLRSSSAGRWLIQMLADSLKAQTLPASTSEATSPLSDHAAPEQEGDLSWLHKSHLNFFVILLQITPLGDPAVGFLKFGLRLMEAQK